MNLLVLLLIFPTVDSHSNTFVSIACPNDCSNVTVNSESQERGRLTVRLVKSLGQAIDTNELERESRVG
jgi:hypothetical protein